MVLFVAGLLLLVGGVALIFSARFWPEPVLARVIGGVMPVVGVLALIFSSAIAVADDKAGLVKRIFGADLPTGRIVATDGEKGPQAQVLGPGWHFGYWPWLYELEQVDTVTIPQGRVGVILALDGDPLPEGEVFANAIDPALFTDGLRFLREGGRKGPQLTILTPGTYRYNPRLFKIEAKPALEVRVGEVAVIKANAGLVYQPAEGEDHQVVNGVHLVPRGYQGIWREAYNPGIFNIHPDAYAVIKVKSTNRIYTYQGKDWAIMVRSQDGFTFPVDVRVSVNVSADNAPFMVAMLGDPDAVRRSEQEDENLEVLEEVLILPRVRSIFRNVAEGMSALQFVNQRSQVQSQATERFRRDLEPFRITTESVLVADIRLQDSDAGKDLLATQTQREVALNQRTQYAEQMKAQEARSELVRATTEADQQKALAEARYQVQVREQQALARAKEAEGEARYIEITAAARKNAYEQVAEAIGREGVVAIELLKLAADGKVQLVPQVQGGGAGLAEALFGRMLMQPPAAAPAPAR